MDKKLLEKTLGIGRILSIQQFNTGFQNIIYKVKSTKGTYCLRIYQRREKNHIEFEIKVLNKLKGLPVPSLQKVKGQFMFKIGNKWAIMYKFIEGKHLKRFTTKQLEECASTLAKMHKRLHGLSWNKPMFQIYRLSDNEIRKYAKVSKNAKLKYLKFLPSITKQLRANKLNKKLARGALHVDISARNILFHKAKISAILDFDNSHPGPLILDLGKLIMFFASENRKFNKNKAMILINAYNKTRKLSKLELLELDKAIRFAFLSHIFMDYYMSALKITTQKYFDWIINDLYASYRDFL